jgi:hypothetical protein
MERRIPLRNDRQFKSELARFTKAERVVHWYTTDHHYIIVLRPLVLSGKCDDPGAHRPGCKCDGGEPLF